MRPKRTAALRSEDKVRSLAEGIIDDDIGTEEGYNDLEHSEPESLELSSPPISGPDDTIDELIASPPRRGRPGKDTVTASRGQKLSTPSSGAKYKKIGDFTPVKPSIYPLIKWRQSLEGARIIKRSSKGRNKLAESDSKFVIPPVDLLAICSEHIESYKHATTTTKSIKATLCKDSFNHEHTIVLNVDSHGRSKHQVRIDAGKMERLDTEDDLIYCLNASTSPSDGGVAAMDWACLNESSVLMVCSTFPSASYANTVIPSDAYHTTSGNNSTMIQLWEVTMTGDFGASLITTHAIKGGDCVKNVALCRADANSFLIAAIASGGRLNLCQYHNAIVSDIACFEDDSFSAVSILPSRESVYVATGTTTGDLYLCNVTSIEASIKRVASVKLSNKPIISIAFTADNPYLMAIGIHDSPSHLVDVRCSDGGGYPLQSSLSYTPLVRWAGVGTKGWIIADTEQSCRFYPASTLADRHSVPLASFPSAVNGVATSALHNIIATSGANGHVHLTWLSPDDDPAVQIEKDILTFSDSDISERHINLTTHLKVPKVVTGKTDLGTPSQWINGLSWCPSPAAPGLLALTSAHYPIIIFIAIDRLAIL